VTTQDLLEQLKRSAVYDLEQTRFAGMPAFGSPSPSFSYVLHHRHADMYNPDENGPRTNSSGAIISFDHVGTHVDALCHQADNMVLYGGIPVTREIETRHGFSKLGAETIEPLIAEGFLLDVAHYLGCDVLPDAYAVTAADLAGCARAQGAEITPGSVVLVRTGFGQLWENAARYTRYAGMSADANRWVAERQPVAVGADNLTWDLPGLRDEESGATMAGHLLLLARRGVHIYENLYLEGLARDEVRHFVFVATPLKVRGATGALVRPIAIRG
jgi:kynurenine formamidase